MFTFRIGYLLQVALFVCSIVACQSVGPDRLFQQFGQAKQASIILSEYGLDSLPPSIGKLRNLQRLYVTRDTSGWTIYPPLSALGEKERVGPCRHLPEEVGELTDLTSLTLVNLNLVSLPESIARLEKLDTLILYANCLTISNELEKLSKLPRLRFLGLLGNEISPGDLEALKAAHPGLSLLPDIR